MPLNVYAGNRMENLLNDLRGVVARPLPSPLDRETIVVQSKGMQRWLSMELSRRFGVWANCDYPFLNEMADRIFRIVLPDQTDTASFEPGLLAWRIMGLIPTRVAEPAFAEIRHYLGGDGDAVKLYQLAEKIADTLDQYILFRPDLLAAWEKGRDGGWQGELWRSLVRESGPRHRAALYNRFREAMDRLPDEIALPHRISLIGIPTLPPFHTDLLARISHRTEVNLFLLNPCRDYWDDIVSGPERVRLQRKGIDGELLETGNPLLASLGRSGRLFYRNLRDSFDIVLHDRYEEAPADGTILHAVQNDILNLADRSRSQSATPVATTDRSLQIHSCHGPLREVEVLHDTLLDLLHRDPSLTPRDIVVMTPDINAYAPYIAAVFGGCRESERQIPYSVADRSIRAEGVVANLLLALLDLCGSRFTAARVLELLDAPPVRQRFRLSDDDLDVIRRWVSETRIRWGEEERDRVRHGLPAYRDNSWRAGFDRLLAGYALPPEADRLYDGILPCEGIEGDAARLLGQFLAFGDSLFESVARLEEPRPVTAWVACLRETAERFVDPEGAFQEELLELMQVVSFLGKLGTDASYDVPVPSDLVRRWLGEKLDREVKGLGFLTGRVTFCRMLPMRSIPFRVVVLLGMNDGAFPRDNRPPGFDLMARDPRPGDRSLRDEDRYLFLEALLSARDALVISYAGQSVRDNSELPPSVLVSELLDYVAAGFRPEGAVGPDFAAGRHPTVDRLVTRHRLQAFSSAYFTPGSGLVSYARENCEALEQRRSAAEVRPFLAAPLPSPPDGQRLVTLPELQRFFANPARQFLRQRLRLRLPDGADELEEREPFDLDALDAYTVRQELTSACLAGKDLHALLPFFRSRGLLPPARHGEILFDGLCGEAAGFAAEVRGVTGGTLPGEPREIDLQIGDFRLTGRLDGMWPTGPVRYRAATMKGKDRLRAWIDHLVACAVTGEEVDLRTVLCMRSRSLAWRRVGDPRGLLETLLQYWWCGQSEPLRFFPASSLAYADGGWNLERARKEWDGGFNRDGEGADPAYRRCFGEGYPFDDAFDASARELLEPLLSHQETA
jgi:exodeoxyribonuclease V gamma subunit